MASLPPLRASVALAAYAEPLLEGRRAIVFGDASSGLAEQLLERGARLVHVYDADAPRLAEAAARNGSRNVAFAPLAEGGLAVREGAFDVAFIENLSAFEDVSEVLRHAKRALSPRGALLAAAPNPEARLRLLAEPAPASTALDYYALYDAASATFAEVRMLGQAPFVGYAVVDFAPEGEPAPSFDAGFVPGGAEEPEWFIALCSEREVRLDEFALIELPFRATRERERPATREPARELAPMRAELAELRAELERREAWITQVEARAEAADTRADQAQAELEERRAAVDAAVERARGAEASARDAEARGRAAAELRAELETRRERAQKLEDERDGWRARAEKLAQERDAELETRRERAQKLEDERDGWRARAEKLAQELAQASEQLAKRAAAPPEDASAELRAYEAQLAERGAEIRRLERERASTEQFARQLLDELELARASGSAAEPREAEELRQQLDALAGLNAEREAELQTARWAVSALEARLAESDSADHGARRERLEADLQQARADLQRLAVLVEELRAGVQPAAGEAEPAR